MRVLLDTDVVLDFLLNRPEFAAQANEVFIRVQNKEIDAYISTVTSVNAFHIIRKARGNDIALEAVEGLVKLVEVCRTDRSVLKNALRLGFSDFEAAVRCASAITENLDAIVTRNTSDYANSTVTTYSPGEFLQTI
ncbi:MAG: PIN domain-containing protein [Pyrinomonadaceae bacterium]|nr:PIN domain-containing protein [Pyrinomonadaceae bacterium]